MSGTEVPSARSALTNPTADGILAALTQVGALMLKPSKFTGTGKPEEAEQWIKEMEKMFRLLNCTDVHKMTPAEYRMDRNAMYWWQAMEDTVFPARTEIVWEIFVTAFYEKYFSSCTQDRKLIDFVELKRGDRTVDEYEAKFSELSRFALRPVEHLEDKAKKFLKGLKPEIRKQLAPFGPMTYREIYSKAQYVEQEMAGEEIEPMPPVIRGNENCGKRPMQPSRFQLNPNKRRFGENFGKQGGVRIA
ncbi:uncharacterized protein LOC115741990 [Rhodamnia argentea]|uniref:Uncharacterized protein LOC115741990 n=1 Tax=Rhodamnia argentea TaxID=178133 RepID=A0A8B8PAW7_9MYRT|nr:uncharacterized protein LOC115741990 [Rhodamnia argentea]